MNNYIQAGDRIVATAPSSTDDVDLEAGDGVLIGSLFGVAVNDAVQGAEVVIATRGVFDLAKTSAQAWSIGDKIYWDSSNQVCTTVSGGNTEIGVAVAAAANPSSTGNVRLNGVGV